MAIENPKYSGKTRVEYQKLLSGDPSRYTLYVPYNTFAKNFDYSGIKAYLHQETLASEFLTVLNKLK